MQPLSFCRPVQRCVAVWQFVPGPTRPPDGFNPFPPEDLDTDFKKKYPPDPFGEEMSDNARVWKVYRDLATAHDESMLQGWHETLNIVMLSVRHSNKDSTPCQLLTTTRPASYPW